MKRDFFLAILRKKRRYELTIMFLCNKKVVTFFSPSELLNVNSDCKKKKIFFSVCYLLV